MSDKKFQSMCDLLALFLGLSFVLGLVALAIYADLHGVK
jgi:hypothetical protein